MPCGPWFGPWFIFPFIGLLVMVLMMSLMFSRRGFFGHDRDSGTTRPVSPSSPSETPHDILKRRYAAGEITREQFEQMRRDIQ